MPTYIFTGRVNPERAWLELRGPVSYEYSHVESQLKGQVTIWIYKNQMTCTFKSEKTVDDLQTLRNLMSDCASDIVDCTALENVVGYEIDLVSLHDIEKGNTIVFGPNIPGLSIKDDERREVDLLPLLTFCGQEPLFRRAVGDFKNGIRHAADTGFFCYRAIESLLHFLASKNSKLDKKAAIAELEKTLNIASICIQKLRELSGEARHGKVLWISGKDRTVSLRVTREILLRFAAYFAAEGNSKPSFGQLLWDTGS